MYKGTKIIIWWEEIIIKQNAQEISKFGSAVLLQAAIYCEEEER